MIYCEYHTEVPNRPSETLLNLPISETQNDSLFNILTFDRHSSKIIFDAIKSLLDGLKFGILLNEHRRRALVMPGNSLAGHSFGNSFYSFPLILNQF